MRSDLLQTVHQFFAGFCGGLDQAAKAVYCDLHAIAFLFKIFQSLNQTEFVFRMVDVVGGSRVTEQFISALRQCGFGRDIEPLLFLNAEIRLNNLLVGSLNRLSKILNSRPSARGNLRSESRTVTEIPFLDIVSRNVPLG